MMILPLTLKNINKIFYDLEVCEAQVYQSFLEISLGNPKIADYSSHNPSSRENKELWEFSKSKI